MSMMAKVADELRGRAEEAIASAAGELDTKAFTKEVIDRLRKYQTDVVWRLLGLDDKWGKWEVDHCNGRNSPITNYLTAETEPLVRQWVSEAVESVIAHHGGKIRQQVEASLKREITDRYSYQLREATRREMDARISREAKEIADQLLDEVAPKFND